LQITEIAKNKQTMLLVSFFQLEASTLY